MARYIDLDKAIQDVESVGAYYSEEETVKELCLLEIKGQPIADVVPRSEVEEIVKFKDMAYAELKSLYIEAKQEIAEQIFEEIEYLIWQYDTHPANELTEEIAELKKKYIGE